MKKKKFPLLALTILLAAGGALATSTKQAPTLYYKNSDGNFYPAGIEGYDFECQFDHFGTCTYTLENGVYKPYKGGKAVFIR